jgi:Fe-S cluster assembly protein SufD
MSALAAKSAPTALDRYRALFEARHGVQDEFASLRRDALERFLAAGFPTQRDEDWKYTNLRRLESRSFAPADSAPIAPDESQWIAGAGARVVLVNGYWMPSLSSASPQPPGVTPGVTMATLGRWIANQPAEAAAFLARFDAGQPATAFEHLNTAFLEDGVVIDIADDVVLDQPIYVIHQWSPGAVSQMSHPRIMMRVGRNSSGSIIEHYLGHRDAQHDAGTFTNACVAIEMGPGARIHHYRLQQESTRSFHIGNTRIRLDHDSRYSSHDIALGASIARVNITALLQGTGAEASLRGLFIPDGTQHLDTQTRVEHIAAHTTSNEEYRGIADGRGRGIFNGKVIVHAGAQKIDSRQSSRNLLLSATAEIDTKPELEIYANDVKCSHGATTGQLDPASLFYLRSRGLSQTEARALLIRAFAESILGTIDHAPVREYLEHRLHDRFARIPDAKAVGANQ